MKKFDIAKVLELLANLFPLKKKYNLLIDISAKVDKEVEEIFAYSYDFEVIDD